MRIPFVGGSFTATSERANTQRTLNAYLEYQRQDDGSSRAIALYGRPGMTLRVTAGASGARGAIVVGDYCYRVVGSVVYRMDSNYALTSCGNLTTNSGMVGLASNGTQVLLVDGTKGWLISGTTLTQITDVDFPDTVTRCAYQDGYFLVVGDGSQRVYWSQDPNSGSAWNGLDFGSAEGAPDDVLAIVSDHRDLWIPGTDSTEIWVNTGNAAAPFQRSGNAFIEAGCAAAWSVVAMNNSVYWLGHGRDGHGMVFRAEGYRPVRVSDHSLEQAISGYATIADAYALTLQFKGHLFYALTFPTADVTWVYDAATDRWFEWSWRDPSTNIQHRWRLGDCVFFGGKHIAGDWETGEIYSLEPDVYTDAGDTITFLRRTQTLNDEGGRLFFEDVEVDMEAGVANADCADPQVMLRYSNDGGKTWSNEKRRSMGAVGEYSKRIRFGPTGAGRNRVWELSVTDPVKRTLFGAWARVAKGG